MKIFQHVEVAFLKTKARLRRFVRVILERFFLTPAAPVCENLVLWSQDRGYKTLRIHDPFILDYPLPDCILSIPRLKAIFQVVNGLGYASQHLVMLPNALIKGHRGLIVFDGIVISLRPIGGRPTFAKILSIGRNGRLLRNANCRDHGIV